MTSSIIKIRGRAIYTAAVLAFCNSCPAAAEVANIYVDTNNGNDTASGLSPKEALRSIEAAQRRVRQADRTGEVVVHLRGGYHFLQRPLRFGPRDGGLREGRVTYRRYGEDERPVISGGINLTGKWSDPDGDGIYQAAVPAGTRSRNLYVAGLPASLAAGEAPFKQVTITDTGFTGDPSLIPDFRNPQLIEFVWPGSWKWRILSMEKAELRDGQTVVTMKQPGWSMRSGGRDAIENPGSKIHRILIQAPTIIRNAWELLDEPGEWYLDPARNLLFYKPNIDVDIHRAETILAQLDETLVFVEGKPENPVRNLSFEGIGFAHAAYLRPQTAKGHIGNQSNAMRETVDNSEVRPASATVRLRYTDGIAFNHAEFFNSGSAGIFFDRGSKNGSITGSRFMQLGGNGIQIGDFHRSLLDIDSCYNCKDMPTADRVTGISIANNHIFRIGIDAPNAAQAIHVAVADNVTIAHNEIHDLGYTAIATGYRWSDTLGPYGAHRIVGNRVYDFMKAGRDGAAIYNVGNGGYNGQPTIVENNQIFGMFGDFAALYPDEGSSDMIWRNNLIENMANRAWLHNNSIGQNMSQRNLKIDGNFSDTAVANYSGLRDSQQASLFIPGVRPAPADAIAANAGVQGPYRHLLDHSPVYQAEEAEGSSRMETKLRGFNGTGYATLSPSQPLTFKVDAGLGGSAKLSIRYASNQPVGLMIGGQDGHQPASLPATVPGDWATLQVSLNMPAGVTELSLQADRQIAVDQIGLAGTLKPNSPGDLVPVAGALTRRSTLIAGGEWQAAERVVDGFDAPGEATADTSEALLTFKLARPHHRFTFMLREDNAGDAQITSWRVQALRNGAWVSLTPWLTSESSETQTYEARGFETGEQIRLLLRNETPRGKVGITEFRAFGTDTEALKME